jgi:hypothetical protein
MVEALRAVALAINRRLQRVAASGFWRVVRRTTIETISRG